MSDGALSPRVQFVKKGETGDGKGILLSDIIDELGFGTFQYKLLFICGLGWAADAAEMVSLSFLLVELKLYLEWDITPTSLAALGSFVYIGMAIGAYVFGVCADRYGRKPSFLATVLTASVFGCASAFAPSIGVLIFFRFLAGIGIGGNLPVDFSIFAEFVPVKDRGRSSAYLNAFWNVGELVSCGLAVALIPAYGWQHYLFATSVLGFFVLFFRTGVPESPRFLMVKGRNDEAWAVLKHVAKQNGKTLRHIETVTVELETERATVSDLLLPEYRRTTLLLWLIWIADTFMLLGLFLFLPTYLQSADTDRKREDLYLDVFLATLSGIPGFVLVGLLVDRIGRIPCLYLGAIASTTLVTTFGVLHILNAPSNYLLLAIFPIKMFVAVTGTVRYIYATEFYPTVLRGTGIGACSIFKRFSGIIVPTLGQVFFSAGLESESIFVWAGFGVVLVVASCFLNVETNNRRLMDGLGEHSPLLKSED